MSAASYVASATTSRGLLAGDPQRVLLTLCVGGGHSTSAPRDPHRHRMNGPRTLREQLMSCMVTLQTAREAAGAANLDDDGSGSDTGSDDGEAPEDGAGVPHLSLILRVLRRSAKTAQLYLVRGATARKR